MLQISAWLVFFFSLMTQNIQLDFCAIALSRVEDCFWIVTFFVRTGRKRETFWRNKNSHSKLWESSLWGVTWKKHASSFYSFFLKIEWTLFPDSCPFEFLATFEKIFFVIVSLANPPKHQLGIQQRRKFGVKYLLFRLFKRPKDARSWLVQK